MAEYYSVAWIDHVLFLHPSVDGHLDPSYLLAIMNDPPTPNPPSLLYLKSKTSEAWGGLFSPHPYN